VSGVSAHHSWRLPLAAYAWSTSEYPIEFLCLIYSVWFDAHAKTQRRCMESGGRWVWRARAQGARQQRQGPIQAQPSNKGSYFLKLLYTTRVDEVVIYLYISFEYMCRCSKIEAMSSRKYEPRYHWIWVHWRFISKNYPRMKLFKIWVGMNFEISQCYVMHFNLYIII